MSEGGLGDSERYLPRLRLDKLLAELLGAPHGPASGLLGTAFTSDRTHAKALGYGAHFINGQIFALLYYAVFAAIGYSSWWLGTVFGLVHGLLAATALVNILLPLVHPRMGTPQTSAPHVSHYSNHRASSCSTTAPATHRHPAAHLAYGTIIGGFLAWPG
ncbi:hypothetical protein ACFY3M_48575 [Streptomyces mirabilis]|uniref:hypothetical protein n=1 Tax=Streptomyces mirabilis TaxID=68239 RepID=UPI00367744E4